MSGLLKDIIELQKIKLVIELDDADKNPESIFNSFIFTEEVNENIEKILAKINSNNGCGIFLKGNFGSGKSHFLSYLFLLIKNKNYINNNLIEKYNNIKNIDFKIIKTSLIKYPSNISLEYIILQQFNVNEEIINRDDIYKKIFNKPTIIIIDELSEFLRSKPNKENFFEDIRYLQYLGEYSFSNPLWIIASLQEWIEETGHISSAIFNRIKDRYPLRINLSSSHIEDIIDQRVIIKKENCLDVIKESYNNLKKYFPLLNLDFNQFKKTYPLHPFTVRFLAGLTPIFSQHRGVIHFVVTEVSKILNNNVDYLLTPDIIFDHFEERIREIPEYSTLVRNVYDYYKLNIKNIFSKDIYIEIAMSIIKILILTEISPLEKKKTAKDITEILLKKISLLSSEINYEIIKDGILKPLVEQKMFIIKEDDIYYIDPKVNEGIKIKSKLKEIKNKFEDRLYFYFQLSNIINIPHLPLSDIKDGKKIRFIWDNSYRNCIVSLVYSNKIKKEELERIINTIETKIDGYLLIFSPFFEDRNWLFTLKESINSNFLSNIIFWIPRKLNEYELNFIEDYLALYILSSEMNNFNNDLKKNEIELKDIVSNIYFEGELIYGDGNIDSNLKNYGYLPIEKFLSYIFNYSLKNVHPLHDKIKPYSDIWNINQLSLIYKHFIKPGKISFEDVEKKGLENFIKQILEPLKIVKQKSGYYFLSLEPENEIISLLLNICSNEEDIHNIRLSFIKGKYGMSIEQINLILLSTISVGYLVPYLGDEIVTISEYSDIVNGVSKIKIGKNFSSDLLSYIKDGEFIWGEVEDTPTPFTQKKMWKDGVSFIKKYRKIIDDLKLFIDKYKDYTLMKKISIDYNMINKIGNFFDSIVLSLPPGDGIEKILLYIKENKDFSENIKYIENFYNFLNNDFQLLNKYFIYITNPKFRASEEIIDKRNYFISKIEEYLSNFKEDFNLIKEQWNNLYDNFLTFYIENHNNFYNNKIFKLKKEVESYPETVVLKNISNIVKSVLFNNNYFDIKREIDKLPNICYADLNYELFISPICKCGYQFGDRAPDIEDNNNYINKIREGILNFIKTIQSPENKEKIESYILSLSYNNKKDILDKIEKLINIDINKINLNLILQYLNEDILTEIENALKGQWKIIELDYNNFFDKIVGRKLKYNDLKKIFFDWIGFDTDSIIYIKDKESDLLLNIKNSLKKYGKYGEKISNEIKIDNIDDKGEILDNSIFDIISLNQFSTDELINFLNEETIDYLKIKLRNEIFYRFLGKIITNEKINGIFDDITKSLLYILKLSYEELKYKGVLYFTKIICPINILYEKIKYINSSKKVINKEVLDKIESIFIELKKRYENMENQVEGVKEIEEIKEILTGNIIIFDGLRYDLWLFLKDIFIEKKFLIREDIYRIKAPTNTFNFRNLIGVNENIGYIDDKKYYLLKWSEQITSKKDIKKIINDNYDIKFLHFNFIDNKIHNSTIDLYPLYNIIKNDFNNGIFPLISEIDKFIIISDHGFVDKKQIKDRYQHGGNSIWEILLPVIRVNYS